MLMVSELFMDRVLFKKGMQRKFLDLVVARLGCISLRGILQFGFDVKYSSLKNYYVERRLMDAEFFEDLCRLAKIDVRELDVEFVRGNWGQVKGGKIGKRRI